MGKHQLTMVRITFGLFLFISICSCQEAPGHPGSPNSVTPTPMPQFVRDMLTRLAEGKRDFHEAENKEYQHSESQSGIGSTISGLLQVLGYDKQQMSSLGVDMVMYLGELAANTILNTEDNNINTELEEYTTKGDRNNVFSMIKMVMDRSSMRGEQIKSSLLDQNLTEKMIQQLSEKTGDSTSCVQMLLCKVFPYISTAQKATDETMNSLFGSSLQSLSQRWMESLWENNPGEEEFKDRSKYCESRYKNCHLLSFT